MSFWNFTGVDFDNMLEEPSWAFSHLPLNNNSEFVLGIPNEEEEEFETIPLHDMYDADDEDSSEDGLDDLLLQLEQEERERLTQEHYSQARDSEQPNSLSNSPDYLRESFFNPQCPPRMKLSSNIRQTNFVIANNKKIGWNGQENALQISEVPRRKIRVQVPSLRLDLPSPIDFGRAFSPNDSETMDNDFVPNMLEGFETMNFGELIQDYESSNILHPTEAQKFRCDIERPDVFSMEPHWFHDTKDKWCWCIYCIQYRKIQSTGEQMEAHDYNDRCLCPSCSEFYHKALSKGQYCNCRNCVDANEDQGLTDQDASFAELQKQIQLQSPERRTQDSEQLVTETSQKLSSVPLCERSTIVANEPSSGSSELLNIVRGNLWLDSDSDNAADFDKE